MVAAPVAPEHDRTMATTSPQDEAATSGQAPKKTHHVWIWISAVLAVVAIGLLIWALQTRSDLNDTQQKNADLQSQVDQGQETGGAVLTAVKGLINDLAAQLGATNEDLADTQEKLDNSQQAEQDAEKAADAAKLEAEKADTATDKAQAEADQAQAEIAVAESKASVAAGCAKAYVSALGTLFESGDQAASVGDQIQGITADCKAALAGT
jgi:chromosome segregation ATPase